MQTKSVLLAALLLCAACASPKPSMKHSRGPASTSQGGELISKPEGEHMDPRENLAYDVDQQQTNSGTCNAIEAAAILMHKASKKMHSSHRGLKAIQEAYKGCAGIDQLFIGGADGKKTLAKAGWTCGTSEPRKTPPGSLVFEGNRVEAHYLVGKSECFVSDFRQKDCKPLVENPHGHYPSIGWCHP